MAGDGRGSARARIPDGTVPRLSTGRRALWWVAATAWAGLLWWLSSRPLHLDAPAGSDKIAHVLAYAVLGFLLRSAFGTGSRRPLTATVAAALIAAAYGAIDEVHQAFVPGRFATVADGLADAVGAVLGAWIAGHREVASRIAATGRGA